MTRSGPFAIALATAALLVSPHARAEDVVQTCATAAETAETLRHGGKLLQARERLLVCTRAVCPTIVRADCIQWLAEVDVALPALVVRARDAEGRDVLAVRVLLDGHPWLDKLDGRAAPV